MARATYNPRHQLQTIYQHHEPVVLVVTRDREIGYYLRQRKGSYAAFTASDRALGIYKRAYEAAEHIYLNTASGGKRKKK